LTKEQGKVLVKK